jgi:hypothetical protein
MDADEDDGVEVNGDLTVVSKGGRRRGLAVAVAHMPERRRRGRRFSSVRWVPYVGDTMKR